LSIATPALKAARPPLREGAETERGEEGRGKKEGGKEAGKKRKPIFIDIIKWDVYFQELLLLLSCTRSSTN